MRRVQHFSFTMADNTPRVPAPPARSSTPALLPRDDMWRSRRVLSGSDWMDAWVRKPGQR